MITIEEVKTRKQQKEFIEFPLKLYKNNPYFVPPLYSDEKKMFKKNFAYNSTCESVFFNAYEDGKMVGRISGILQKASNEKNHEKRVRFTRFDSLDKQEIADALFHAVEQWAVSKGMDTICGPLGYSDLEREGLLVEGFDQMSTFEEQYNAEYYGKLIENCGYVKEVDWNESKIYLPEEEDNIDELSEMVLKRAKLHYGKAKNIRDFINRYADQFFELLDIGYDKLYGTVPFSDEMKKMTIDNFILIVDLKDVAVLLDENDRLVCLGICFPSMGEALQKSGGRLTPVALVKLLHALKKPKVLDLGLVAVAPEYINRGITAVIVSELRKIIRNSKVEYCETNLNLEDNYAIQNCWKRFKSVRHKRRRSYVKTL